MVFGQIVAIISAAALVRVLTEFLDPAEYGRLALGLTIAGLVNQLIMGGIKNGVMRFYSIAAEQDSFPTYLAAVGRVLGYATLVILAAGTLALGGMRVSGVTNWVELASWALLFSIVSGFKDSLAGILSAARRRAAGALLGFLDACLKIGIAFFAVTAYDSSAKSVMIGYALWSLLGAATRFSYLKLRFQKSGPPGRPSAHWQWEIWRYSWPFATWGIFTWAQQASDRWALETFLSTRDVGLYTALFQLGYMPISVAAGFAISFLEPILFQRSGDATDPSRNRNIRSLVLRITAVSVSCTLIAALAVHSIHDWVFELLVGEKFRGVSQYLSWLILAGGLFASGQMLSIKLLSDMNPKRMMPMKIGTAVLGAAANFMGAYFGGLQGVIAAAVFFALIHLLWTAKISLAPAAGQD